MADSGYADVAGLLDVQKNYVADVNAGVAESKDTPDMAKNLVTINTGLAKLATDWGNNSAGYLLTGQDTVFTILDREKNRLDEKAKGVTIASQGQDRLIQLNTNYKKRYAAYNAIILTVVLALAAFAGLVALRSVPFIPAVALNVASIALLAATVIYCGRRYASIATRDSIHFDELDTNSAYMKSTGGIVRDLCGNNTSGTGVGLNFGIGGCVGQACCSGNTFWDSADSVCVPQAVCDSLSATPYLNVATNSCSATAVSAMTTLATAYSLGDLSRRGPAEPSAPAGMAAYVKV